MTTSFKKLNASFRIDTVIVNASYQERLQSEANGTCYVKEQTVVCTFVEKTDGGDIKTVVTMNPDDVTIHRSGAVQMRQQFVQGKKTKGTYLTTYGRFEMEIKTKYIQFMWEDKNSVGELNLKYDLWMQDHFIGCYHVMIRMEGV